MDLAGALGLGDRELVAFVGAGGKKTAMAHLIETATDRGLRAGYTTTTHTPPPDDIPLVLADDESLPAALSEAGSPVAFAAERVSDPDRATEKVRGFDAGVVDDLFVTGQFDWLLVKADGARRREFKAPGPDEPVLPSTASHVVPVASVKAVGEPLDAPTVHRPERVADVAGVSVGETVTAAVVGRVLASKQGGLKGVPQDATVTPVLNKADTPERREVARAAVQTAIAGSDRLDRGLVTSFRTDYCAVVTE